jgi:hypothetical protein
VTVGLDMRSVATGAVHAVQQQQHGRAPLCVASGPVYVLRGHTKDSSRHHRNPRRQPAQGQRPKPSRRARFPSRQIPSPVRPSVSAPSLTPPPYSLGSKAARKQLAVPTHQTKLSSTTSPAAPPLLGFSPALFGPKTARADASKPSGSGGKEGRHEQRACLPAANPKQQRRSRREPPPPTHQLPPVVASAWVLVEQLVGTYRIQPQRESEPLSQGGKGEMKKLYQGGKGRRVHPAPADASAAVALPAAVLALASALTAEEQEVLAYLLSCGGGGRHHPGRRRGPHPPEMGCACFGCYKSFWARWDASPNRHLIHRIIDAVEEEGGAGAPRRPPRRRRRGGGAGGGRRGGGDAADEDAAETGPGVDHDNLPACDGGSGMDMDHRCHGEYDGDGDEEDEEASSVDGDDASVDSEGGGSAEKSTVGRLVRFIGEKVWGAWN